MAQHNDLGTKGEEIAQTFLKKNGYQILETNWQFHHAEIDIIAQKNNTLAVVEVKTRSSDLYGKPEAFVSKKKIKLMINAIDHYVQKNNLDVEIRFDIISIIKNKYTESIDHIENAFVWF